MSIRKIVKSLYSCVTFMVILSFAITPAFVFPQPAFAGNLPEGATIVAGKGWVDANGNVMNVNQWTDSMIIDWISFCIAAGYTVNFNQPGADSVCLNRVTGGSISEIFGALNANGNVWLINPNGIIFGPSSRINAAGFLGSTLDIDNDDFLNGVYVFANNKGTNGYIINKGRIEVDDNGYVVLMGGAVHNEGLIYAKLGEVVLAAGNKVVLELDGAGTMSVVIEDPITAAVKDADGNDVEDAVLNTGEIAVEGGRVLLTANVLKDIFENAVNNEGLIKANTLVDKEGEVYLLAEGEDARASNTGTIDASADGEGEDGGFVEISGDRLHIGGNVYVWSLRGAAGHLLIDPYDLYIVDGPGAYSTSSSTVGEDWLEDQEGNLTLSADNDVYFDLSDNELNLHKFGTGETFMVKAKNDINLNNDNIVTQGGNVGLYADSDASGAGDVTLGNGAGIKTNGGDVTLSGVNLNIISPIGTNGFVVDTADGAFRPYGTLVLGAEDPAATKYTYDWEYFEEPSDRDYKFTELGFYYYNSAAGKYEYIPFVKGADIGRDGMSPESGNGIIYGDRGDLELYTKFRGYQNEPLEYHQNRAFNDGGLEHAIITPTYTGPGSYQYIWEDLIDLGGPAQPEPDYNDAVMNFAYDRTIPPPPTVSATPTAKLFWDMRFKIPKKPLTDTLQITYTNGPIELVAEQIYFYHPLVEMEGYEAQPMEEGLYEFIDGSISHKNPALLPIVAQE